jgi:hypothetical protein
MMRRPGCASGESGPSGGGGISAFDQLVAEADETSPNTSKKQTTSGTCIRHAERAR